MEVKATMDTGATASFISEELADRLRAVVEVVATRREVRMADGRFEEVTSLLEVDVGLGERTVRMQLLILHNIIDALVLGWDFLTKVGARIACAGLSATIPAGQLVRSNAREKLSVAVVERTTDFAEEDIDGFLKAELADLGRVQGTSTVAVHRITMKDDQPVKQRYYPKNPKMQVEINAKVDELLQKGCIEPSRSPYSSPIVMVKKKTGQWRLCVDFRQINAVREGCVPDANDQLHSGSTKGGEIHKQSGFEGRVLADSVGSSKSAIYGIYGAGKGPVPMESNAFRTALRIGNVPAGVGPGDRTRDDATRICVPGRHNCDRTDTTRAQA
ncbi:uncharacterized protein LOC122756400 [Drosophila santomea]|uniref:uncharacterized protein LOC122756400 n=1 Tax=Drosophila santomea TaxID=129105 RepID=UPI001CCEF243|nr:uncharacterized protein LOC122756400 [Drosophila santomea]